MSTMKIRPPKKPRKPGTIDHLPVFGEAETAINNAALNGTFSRLTEISEKHGIPAAIATAMGEAFAIGHFFHHIQMTEGWIQMNREIAKMISETIRVENAKKPV